MEAFVVLGVVAIGLKIGNTMSNQHNSQQRTSPKRRRKRIKKYIVYPNIVVDDIDILNELDAMEKGFEIRAAIRV